MPDWINPFQITESLWAMNWTIPLLLLEWILLGVFFVGIAVIGLIAAIKSINPGIQTQWLSKITQRRFFWHISIIWIVAMVALGIWFSILSATKIESSNAVTIPNTAKLSVKMLGRGGAFAPSNWFSVLQGQQTGIAIEAKVWNTGAPSTAVEWSLTVTPKGQPPVVAQWAPIPKSGILNMSPSDDLNEKTRNIPIGDIPVEGTLLFYVKLNQFTVIDSSTTLKLSVRDIYGGIASDIQVVGDLLILP